MVSSQQLEKGFQCRTWREAGKDGETSFLESKNSNAPNASVQDGVQRSSLPQPLSWFLLRNPAARYPLLCHHPETLPDQAYSSSSSSSFSSSVSKLINSKIRKTTPLSWSRLTF